MTGIITNGNAPIDIANFGTLTFFGNSAVGPATITTKSGGSTVFDIGGQTDGINAVNARLITEGGGTVDVSQGGPGVVVDRSRAPETMSSEAGRFSWAATTRPSLR